MQENAPLPSLREFFTPETLNIIPYAASCIFALKVAAYQMRKSYEWFPEKHIDKEALLKAVSPMLDMADNANIFTCVGYVAYVASMFLTGRFGPQLLRVPEITLLAAVMSMLWVNMEIFTRVAREPVEQLAGRALPDMAVFSNLLDLVKTGTVAAVGCSALIDAATLYAHEDIGCTSIFLQWCTMGAGALCMYFVVCTMLQLRLTMTGETVYALLLVTINNLGSALGIAIMHEENMAATSCRTKQDNQMKMGWIVFTYTCITWMCGRSYPLQKERIAGYPKKEKTNKRE